MLAEMVLPRKQWLQKWAEGTLTEIEQENPGYFVISKWPPEAVRASKEEARAFPIVTDERGTTLLRAGDSPDFEKQWREVLMPSEIDARLAETERELAEMPPRSLYEEDGGNDDLHIPARASVQHGRAHPAPREDVVTQSRPQPLGVHAKALANANLGTLGCLHFMEAHKHQRLLDHPDNLLYCLQTTVSLCLPGGTWIHAIPIWCLPLHQAINNHFIHMEWLILELFNLQGYLKKMKIALVVGLVMKVPV
ncbi:hypothetical protein PM082_009650 [Marasmius tenuissimus]|nr:hypothetical protein PM082_009650 [Marasmius tenuissimus]